jgi:hypothetical protein
MTADDKKSPGMSLILYTQREAINLRPTSEVVAPTVGECLCLQMSTEGWKQVRSSLFAGLNLYYRLNAFASDEWHCLFH